MLVYLTNPIDIARSKKRVMKLQRLLIVQGISKDTKDVEKKKLKSFSQRLLQAIQYFFKDNIQVQVVMVEYCWRQLYKLFQKNLLKKYYFYIYLVDMKIILKDKSLYKVSRLNACHQKESIGIVKPMDLVEIVSYRSGFEPINFIDSFYFEHPFIYDQLPIKK